MTRLPFRLAEYAPCITWASSAARQRWEPRLQRVSQAWPHVEREAVAEGVKPSCLQHVATGDLSAYMEAAARRNLIALPLSLTTLPASYASATLPGGPPGYKVALTTQTAARDWADAWKTQNDDAIGDLLGFPPCCRTFFQRVWNVEQWFDTTYPMSLAGTDKVQWGANILWRWHGIRAVSHLPCSFRCQSTQHIAEQLLSLFPADEQAWLLEVLHWPVKWTALHGIAEITTPIHRTHVATDATAELLTVRLETPSIIPLAALRAKPYHTGIARGMPDAHFAGIREGLPR